MNHDIIIPPYLALPLTFPQSGQTIDWGHKYVGAADFYEKTKGAGTIIFVLDTAGRFDHPDLADNTLNQFAKDFTDSTTDTDEHGHGTHCAGIAAATDNDIGVIGIAPEALLVPVKVLKPGGGTYGWLADGIRYAADVELPGYEDHKRIISMSLGGPSPSKAVEDAINYAIDQGCFVTAAAGNSGYQEGQNSIGYPGRYEQVVTVASIGKSGDPSRFSSGGQEVDIAAPGEGILSTHLGGGYVYLSGTSMATPIVAGIMALLASHYGDELKTQARMEYFLEKHAKDIHLDGEDDQTGAGLPLIAGYLEQLPDNPPETPEEPEDPKRDARVLHIDAYNIPILWRRFSSKQWNTDAMNMRLEITTTTDADRTVATWNGIVNDFFQNRAFLLLDNHDWADAAYWAARFFSMIVGRIYSVRIVWAEGFNGSGELTWPENKFSQATASMAELPSGMSTFYLNDEALSSIIKTTRMSEYGIKETEELFDAAVSIKDAIALAKADDGKVNLRKDYPFFITPFPKLIVGVEGARQVPKELQDLDEQELARLRDRFGDLIDDERYQRAFYGLAIAGDAILEIVQDEQDKAQAA